MKGRVRQFIIKNHLLNPEDLHLVAISGGADSVALLLILIQFGYRIEAVHCNFQLRGDESFRDEQFVKELCKKYNIPLHIIHFDTNTYAEIHQVSIEMAARELRYRYFEELRQDIGAADICVAHHRDDAVETFLLNLLRGTGIHGLTGIRPRNGYVVRPLLDVSRQEILDFLDSNDQLYVTDSSNLVNDVVRNKLRLDVLPLLRSINPKVSENISRTAHRMTDVERVFNVAMESAQKRVCIQGSFDSEEGGIIDMLALQHEMAPEYVLFELLSPLGFSPDSIEQVAKSLHAQPGRCFLSEKFELLIDRHQIIVQPRMVKLPSLRIPEPGVYIYGDKKLRVEQMNEVTVSHQDRVATLDASLITFPLTLRPAKEGDRFVPFGMTGSRLVSDYLTDQKVNLFEKRQQLVVTDTKETIVWLVGRRTDNRFRVSEATTSILRISLE